MGVSKPDERFVWERARAGARRQRQRERRRRAHGDGACRRRPGQERTGGSQTHAHVPLGTRNTEHAPFHRAGCSACEKHPLGDEPRHGGRGHAKNRRHVSHRENAGPVGDLDARRRPPHRLGKSAPAHRITDAAALLQRLRPAALPRPGDGHGMGREDESVRGRERPHAVSRREAPRPPPVAFHRHVLPHRRRSHRDGVGGRARQLGDRRAGERVDARHRRWRHGERASSRNSERAARHAESRTRKKLSLDTLARGGSAEHETHIIQTWGAWYRDALRATADIEVGGSSAQTRAAIDAAVARVETATSQATTKLKLED